jgi:hypothetical protein
MGIAAPGASGAVRKKMCITICHYPGTPGGGAFSLSKEIYILPLILDLLFWMCISSQVLKFVRRLPMKIEIGFRVALLIIGTVAFILMLATLAFNELFFSLLPTPGPFYVTAVRQGFGV